MRSECAKLSQTAKSTGSLASSFFLNLETLLEPFNLFNRETQWILTAWHLAVTFRDVNSRYNLWIAGTARLQGCPFLDQLLAFCPEAAVVLGACVKNSSSESSDLLFSDQLSQKLISVLPRL